MKRMLTLLALGASALISMGAWAQADVSLAMQYGYSSGNGLGVGLPGARWLMDEFNIQSSPGKGTGWPWRSRSA